MILTNVQQYIMKLLKTYRCLRDDQIDTLVCTDMRYRPKFAVRQRERLLELCVHLIWPPLDGYIGMAGAAPDFDLIAATDLMLEFRMQGLTAHRPGRPPFKLAFVMEDLNKDLKAYYVAVVHKGSEFLISQQAQGAYRGRENAVLFLMESIEQADSIEAPFEHYYVVTGGEGYRFYEGVTV